MQDNKKAIGYYIGHIVDQDICYRASSGGIGTAIVKYLFSFPEYKTSVTFYFDEENCRYIPKLIYQASDINICGSIYQDIDLVGFIRQHLSEISGGIVLTCLPCQVNAIRALLEKHNIPNFIISFVCSGQTTLEGTYCYYRFLGIKKENIKKMQYRGNGWPSGIQIFLKDGTEINRDNYSEPWSLIHRSVLFRPKRCFFCKKDTSYASDISLADPWLDEYIAHDKIGNTMFLVNTNLGQRILLDMSSKNIINTVRSSWELYCKAQAPNVNKEIYVYNKQNFLRMEQKIVENRIYHRVFSLTPFNMKIHLYLMRILDKIYMKRYE